MNARMALATVVVALGISPSVASTPPTPLNVLVRGYLESKSSPLAQETDYILQQKHWKLLIAISAIESQYCRRQLGNNCWGITDIKGGYRKYGSFKEGIKDANDLIERWQKRGKWLTIESMNCSYVVPCNPNWLYLVTTVNEQMTEYERRSTTISQ